MSHLPCTEDAALILTGISKTFLGTVALNNMGLTVRSGSVHGLVGENGSGKSTLIKVLAGYHAPDPGGQVRVLGRQATLPIPQGCHKLGMSFVHQELGLAAELSVAENLLVREVTGSGELLLNWRALRRKAADILTAFELPVNPRRRVGSLSRSQRSMLAIIRAINDLEGRIRDGGGGLLILDEPSGAFSDDQRQWMKRAIEAFVRKSGSVLLISHDNDEILGLADEVTIIRDGNVVATVPTDTTSDSMLTELIIGRPLIPMQGSSLPSNELFASIEGLKGGGVSSTTFGVRQREVLGLTGLLGSGYEEVLPLLFGASSNAASGRLVIQGDRMNLSDCSPRKAMHLGLALVPEDRVHEGCVGDLTIADNMSLGILDQYRSRIGLRRQRMRRDANRATKTYGIKAPSAGVDVGTLSGGNQQKVLLAKWLRRRPRLLMLQEPTVGLDVGARYDIFETLREYVSEGAAIICASSDWEQLAILCDRVAVFDNGCLDRYVERNDLTASNIGHACYEAARKRKPIATMKSGGQQ